MAAAYQSSTLDSAGDSRSQLQKGVLVDGQDLVAALHSHRELLRSLLANWHSQQEELFTTLVAAAANAQFGSTGTLEASTLQSVQASDTVVTPAPRNRSPETLLPEVDHNASPASLESWCTLPTDDGSPSLGTSKRIESGRITKGSTVLSLASADTLSSGSFILSKVQAPIQRLRNRASVLRDKYSWEPPDTFLVRIVKSRAFETMCSLAIISNALFTAIATDYALVHPEMQSNTLLDGIELGYTAYFTAEMLVRLVGFRWYFFVGKNCSWNYMDVVLVLFAVYDQIAGRIGAESSNISFMRLVRISKISKILRMGKLVRMFRDLRLLLNGILGSVKAMTWSIILIVAVTYMFGICILQATIVIGTLDWNTWNKWEEEFRHHWGSVGTSMVTLYMSSTGGVNWRVPAEPLWSMSWLSYGLFLLYISFFMFVVTNTVTSIFIAAMIEHAENDTHQTYLDQVTKMRQLTNELKTHFEAMDAGGHGLITREDFFEYASNPRMHAFFYRFGIDIVDAEQFFDIISSDGTYAVDMQTFVMGCTLMRGTARSMDLLGLINAQHRSFESLTQRLHRCEGMLQRIESSTSRSRGMVSDNGSRRPSNLFAHSIVLEEQSDGSDVDESFV